MSLETPKLFFFPEVFLPGKFSNFQFYIKPFLALTEKANIGVIAGTLSENEDKIYNSLISFGNVEGKYDKEVLVPFGEYVPYDFFNYFFNFFNFSRPEVSAAKIIVLFMEKIFLFLLLYVTKLHIKIYSLSTLQRATYYSQLVMTLGLENHWASSTSSNCQIQGFRKQKALDQEHH